MKKLIPLLVSAVVVTVLSGCAAKISTAQNKTATLNEQSYVLGGTYNYTDNKLHLSINGDTVMSGSFLPYTPQLTVGGSYQGKVVKGSCYFGSVLGDQGGLVGIVAGAIQSAKNSSGDKCDIIIDGQQADTLYF